MTDNPETSSQIVVKLKQVGSTVCEVRYLMSQIDNTPGQRCYATAPGVSPYGECFEVSDSSNTGTTWMLYLYGDGTCYAVTPAHTLDREPEDDDVVGTYSSTGSRLATVEWGTNLG